MRDDYYTNTEADAAAFERGRGDADYYDNDDEGDDPGYFTAPRVTGDPLVNAVNTALIWSGALCGRWTPGDIVRTAEGVVAFALAPVEAAEFVSDCLAREGFETMLVEGRMYVRRAVAGAA